MYHFQISEVLDHAWALTKKYGLILALLVLGINVLPNLIPTQDTATVARAATQLSESIQRGEDIATALTIYGAEIGQSTNYAAGTLQWIISIVLTAGFILILLSLAKGERSDVSFDAVKRPVMTYVKYAGVYLLKALFVGIATVCCILPGIWVAVRLSLADAYILDHEEMGVWDAIKASWRATDGHFWGLLGLGILSGLIAMLGYLACCIGVFYTSVIAAFAYVIVYLILSGHYAKSTTDVEEVSVEIL